MFEESEESDFQEIQGVKWKSFSEECCMYCQNLKQFYNLLFMMKIQLAYSFYNLYYNTFTCCKRTLCFATEIICTFHHFSAFVNVTGTGDLLSYSFTFFSYNSTGSALCDKECLLLFLFCVNVISYAFLVCQLDMFLTWYHLQFIVLHIFCDLFIFLCRNI